MKRSYTWVTDEERDQMVQLYRSGLSTNEVGRAIGRSKATVRDVLFRLGEPLRPLHPRGPANKMWKGRTSDARGYIYLRVLDDDSLATTMATTGGRVFEHRLVVARSIGRPLEKDEHVHHINGDKSDNRLENLQLVRVNHHPAGVRLRCRDCGSSNVTTIKMSKERA